MSLDTNAMCKLPKWLQKQYPDASLKAQDLIVRRKRLEQELSYAYRILGVCGIIAAILVGMFAYCIIQIYKIFMFYKTRMMRKKQKRPNTRANSQNNHSNDEDDYVFEDPTDDPRQHAEAKDDYYMFQDNINKSLASFKNYNAKVQDYFMKTRNTNAPDQYDTRILSIENDNW